MRWQALIERAHAAWMAGDAHAALQLCDQAAHGGGQARYAAALLRGRVLLQAGDAAGALSSFETVADVDVVDAEIDCARGLALFELCRFPEAENALRSALRGNPELAEAHHTLGLLSELNEQEVAVEHFRQARRLRPDLYPAAQRVTASEFAAALESAIASLPDSLRQALEEIPVLVADTVPRRYLELAEAGMSPRALSAFVGFREAAAGTPAEEADHQPALLLFKRNIERACAQRPLQEVIRGALLEEAAQHSGLHLEATPGEPPP